MATYEGNVLRPPGFGPTVTVDPPEELIAAYGEGILQKGGTVLAGVGVLRVGEPMKRSTDGKTWVKSVLSAGAYDQVDGLNRTAVDATSTNQLINVVLGGNINVKVQAITPTNGAALATALKGKYIPKFEYISF